MGLRQLIECMGICVLALAHGTELSDSEVYRHIIEGWGGGGSQGMAFALISLLLVVAFFVCLFVFLFVCFVCLFVCVGGYECFFAECHLYGLCATWHKCFL